MPRQTTKKLIKFPDGFKMGIDVGNGLEDVGLLSAGTTATLSSTPWQFDAGNYGTVFNKNINPTIALAPSALLNFNPTTIKNLFGGFFKVDAGNETLEYAGTSNLVQLTRATIKLIHFSADDTVSLVEDDITALNSGVNNDLITVPKTTFASALDWSNTLIDGYVEIDSMYETKAGDADLVASQGKFYTDDTNLYFIVDAGTYGTLADAKTGLAGTEVKFYTAIDWQFFVYNAVVDAGATFNFKGTNEDGLNEITVSFTGKPDPANSYRLFKLFEVTV